MLKVFYKNGGESGCDDGSNKTGHAQRCDGGDDDETSILQIKIQMDGGR